MSAKLLISARGSKFFFAQSSQNGQPVSGEKCHAMISLEMRFELLLGWFGSERSHHAVS